MAEASRPGAPDCGLYLKIQDDFDFESLVHKLRQLFFITTRSAYEKNMHVLEFPGLPHRAEEIGGLIGYAQQNGFVALVRDEAGLAMEWNADGVIFAAPGKLPPARMLLGEDAIIGLRCGRDAALANGAADLGADYVALDRPAPQQVLQWVRDSEIPLMAEGLAELSIQQVRAGATFVECAKYILDHPAGVKQGAVDMLHLIDVGLGVQQPH